MKKLFTLAAAVLASVCLMAQTTLFSMEVKSSGSNFSASTTETEITTSNYLASISGGTLHMAITSGSNQKVFGSDNSEYHMRLASDKAYAKITLSDNTLAQGDVISFTEAQSTGEPYITKDATRASTIATSSKTYTIPENSPLIGSSVIYLWKSGSNVYIQALTITRTTSITPVCPSGLSISGKKNYVEGEKIELTATLEAGNGTITYQWYKGGTAEANKLAGKTAAKLEIANCAGSDAGDYYCVASKADCDDASNAEAYAVTVNTIAPTGTANISYAMSGSTVTGTATGVNSISGLSTSLTLSTLTLSGTKDGYSGAIKNCDGGAEVNEDIYADLQFTVAEGYVFTPSAISVKANPLSSTSALKAVVKIMDGTTTVASNALSCAKETNNEAVFADGAFTGKLFEGTVHIRMYFYGAASDKTFYLKSPITIEGTVAVAPTKYNVTFAAGAGTGTMATLKYVEGAEVTLPACTFTAPAGKEFDAWTSSDVTISDNKFTMPAKNVTITATWKTELVRHTVTYKEGETTLGTEEVIDGESPAEYTTYQTKQLATYVWCNDAELNNEIAIASAVITKDTILYAKVTYKYAQSINIEGLILEKGKSYNTKGELGTRYYASNYSSEGMDISNDSLNNGKGANRNYDYLGLKVKSASLLNFRLAEGKTVKIKFGDVRTTPQVSINGGDYAAITITDGVYTHVASADELISFYVTEGNKAVVLKQIVIGDAPEFEDVVYAINYAEATHGTISGWALALPGEKVTLTVTPASGYQIASVKYNDGTDHVIEAVESVYSFTMPSAAANVSATFDVATSLDNAAEAVKAVKFIENGQLYIQKDGKIYNVMGMEIR